MSRVLFTGLFYMFLLSKLRTILSFIIIFFVGLGVTSIFFPHHADASDSWLTGWTYRRAITINHAKVGGTLENETDFPVLISLTGLSNINTNGTDIRFTTSDGVTPLPREIESYSGGVLTAWVKVPTLSYTTDTVIYMYYGNASATEPTASSTYGSQNVWTNSFSAVWHLDETGSGTAGDYKDSTSNANASTNTTDQPTVTTSGKINSAESFNGTSSYISAGNNAVLNTAQFSVDFWVYTDTYGIAWNTFLAKEIWGTSKGWLFYRATTGNLIFTRGGTDEDISAPITDGWHHVVGTYNGTVFQLWIDGSSGGSKTASFSVANTAPFYFGSRHGSDGTGNADYGKGILDEVRFSSAARSSGWVGTEYNNQSSPSTFATAGSQETYTAPATSGSSSSSSGPSVSTPSCGNTAPRGVPYLYEIDSSANDATLYFVPVSGADSYFIRYGTDSSANQYAVSFAHTDTSGAVPYTIHALEPGVTYYYTVRAGNGCAAGNWSNIVSSLTKGGTYVAPASFDDTKEAVIPSSTPEPVLEIAPPKQENQNVVEPVQEKPISVSQPSFWDQIKNFFGKK